jgi:hypothetical protein
MAKKERENYGAPLGVPQRPLEQITWSSRRNQRPDVLNAILGSRSPIPLVTLPERPVERVPLE